MMAVDLSLLEPAPVQPGEAPVSFVYEKWVAAGNPCLRQSCGHPHADHIPSEALECNQCDCLRFVGFAQPDDRRCHGAELTACCERDAFPLRAALPPGNGHDEESLRRKGSAAGHHAVGLRRIRLVAAGHQPQRMAPPDPDQHLHQHLPQEAAASTATSPIATTC